MNLDVSMSFEDSAKILEIAIFDVRNHHELSVHKVLGHVSNARANLQYSIPNF
jgi:hypothetical protein